MRREARLGEWVVSLVALAVAVGVALATRDALSFGVALAGAIVAGFAAYVVALLVLLAHRSARRKFDEAKRIVREERVLRDELTFLPESHPEHSYLEVRRWSAQRTWGPRWDEEA